MIIIHVPLISKPTSFTLHVCQVWALAFSPNGDLLVTGDEADNNRRTVTAGMGGGARVWDVRSGQQVGSLELGTTPEGGHPRPNAGGVTSVAFFPPGPDDALLDGPAVGSSTAGNCMEAEVVSGIKRRGDTFSHLVTGCEDKIARVWEAFLCDETTESSGREPRSRRIAEQAPDGGKEGPSVAPSNSWPCGPTVTVTPAPPGSYFSGRCLAELRGHSGKVTSVAVSSDGRMILTTSIDRTAKVWTEVPVPAPAAGQGTTEAGCPKDARESPPEPPDGVQSVEPPGIYSDGPLPPVDNRRQPLGGGYCHWECVQTLVGHSEAVWGGCFEPDTAGRGDSAPPSLGGRSSLVVATCSGDTTAKVWLLKLDRAAACVSSLTAMAPRRESASLPPDSPSGDSDNANPAEPLTNVTDALGTSWSSRCLVTLAGHSESVWAVKFCPGSGGGSGGNIVKLRSPLILATASGDCTIRLWEVSRAPPSGDPPKSHLGPPTDCGHPPTASPNGGHEGAAAAAGENALSLSDDVDDYRFIVRCISKLEGHSKRVTCLTFAPELQVRDYYSESASNSVPGSPQAGIPLKIILASGSGDETVRIWDVGEEFASLMRIPAPSNSSALPRASARGTAAAGAASDASASPWTAGGDEEGGHSGAVTCVAFRPLPPSAVQEGSGGVPSSPSAAREILATCGDDKIARLWDVHSGG